MGIRRDVFNKLVERAAGVFGVSAAGLAAATRFAEDLNAKSTQITQITTFLEDEFDTEIPFMEFRRKPTFQEAVDFIVTECLDETLDEGDDISTASVAEAAPAAPAEAAPAAAPAAAAPVQKAPGEKSGDSELPEGAYYIDPPQQPDNVAKSDHDAEINARKRFAIKEMFQGEEIEAIYMVARKPTAVDPSVDLSASDDPMARMGQGFCPAFNQRTYECAPGVMCDQDVPVVMRDGVTIYTDIYRPKDTSQQYPVIVSWSWFGKRPGEGMSEWQIMGVPPHTVSRFAKFES
ncbi:MAG: hypothetical protein IKE31_07850, partial [Eubacterium sp.]|nr:hypothetical protein [Eubacterium sp.]